jgi:undecaprenyl-diphosphatase
MAWIRRRYPRQVAWSRRRLDASDPRGFWLTFTVAAGGLAGWAFGAITQDVVAHDEAALDDPHVAAWMAAHRTGWLTDAAKAAGWLGSAFVLVVLVAAAIAVLAARRDRRPAIMLALALGGSLTVNVIVQQLVGRSRPAAALAVGHYPGPAFTSGVATAAVACYGMLAIILAAGRSPRTRALLWACAAAITAVAGASQVYLGANWLTDVLGGWALGALWIAIILIADLLLIRPGAVPAGPPARPAAAGDDEPSRHGHPVDEEARPGSRGGPGSG